MDQWRRGKFTDYTLGFAIWGFLPARSIPPDFPVLYLTFSQFFFGNSQTSPPAPPTNGAVAQHHNISAFSYIGVQVFELAHPRQFRSAGNIIPTYTSKFLRAGIRSLNHRSVPGVIRFDLEQSITKVPRYVRTVCLGVATATGIAFATPLFVTDVTETSRNNILSIAKEAFTKVITMLREHLSSKTSPGGRQILVVTF
ncbi:hypothetical protein B0H14DRAFT_2575338 [Mycena olivaceomarginata]|nr:hypothetical protein B0H14DRAFT_2575338 [Mycena olivaceomarginata]